MVITIEHQAPRKEVESLIRDIESKGLKVQEMVGETVNILGLIGDTTIVDETRIGMYPWVLSITHIATPYKKVSRQFHPEDTIIDVNGVKIGGNEPIVVMGGPCSVESEEQIMEIAEGVKEAGAKMLRGGAYKPRTSPYVFQGLKSEGIRYLCEAREKTHLPIVTEMMSVDKLDEFVENI